MTLHFEGHRLDLGTRQLFRGDAELHVSPKAFELLHVLVAARPSAVSKGELHDRLWPGTFVTESNLASLVAELRRALDDSPQTPKFIRTVHRFGYAFCAAVADDSSPPAAQRTCWIVCNGREIPLADGENVIGRDQEAAVRLDTPSVSRRHARIVVAPDVVTLEDLGSKNGTRHRQAPIAGSVRLSDLDEIEVGSIRMIVRIMSDDAPTQTTER